MKESMNNPNEIKQEDNSEEEVVFEEVVENSKNKIIVKENFGGQPRTKEFYEKMRSYGEGILSNEEIYKKREEIETRLEEIVKDHDNAFINKKEQEKLEKELGKLDIKMKKRQDGDEEKFFSLKKERKGVGEEKKGVHGQENSTKKDEEEEIAEITSEKTLEENEEILTKSREALAREYAGLEEKKFGYFGDTRVSDPEYAQKIALIEDSHRNNLKKYRRSLLMKSGKREDVENIFLKTVANEASKLYDLKQQIRLENNKGNKVEQMKRGIKKTIEFYRKMPTKYKLAVSVGLLGSGFVAGAIGGATGGTILASVFVGKGIKKLFGGAVVAVAAEALIQQKQDKGEKKEVLDKFNGESLVPIINKKNVELDKKLFELEGEKHKKKVQRFALAGVAGALVGGGVVGRVLDLGWESHDAHNFYSGSVREDALREVVPETITVKPGDSIWKISENWLNDNGKLEGLNEKQKIYVTDFLKDRLIKGMENPDLIHPGDQIDFKNKFKPEDIDKVIKILQK